MDTIAAALQPLAVPLADIHPDPANARTGHAIDRIAASLAAYGQRTPLVVNRSQGNKIEKGNGTYAAARSLGWSHIAVVFVEDDPSTAAAYGIADNRTGDLSTWDGAALKAIIDGIDPDLDLPTGFEAGELDDILAGLIPPAGTEWRDAFGGLPDGDRAPFQQMTFTLHDTQAEQVKAALEVAASMGAYDSPNENSNGNALARICEVFMGDYGQG